MCIVKVGFKKRSLDPVCNQLTGGLYLVGKSAETVTRLRLASGLLLDP